MAKLLLCEFQSGRPTRVHTWIDTRSLEPKYGLQQKDGRSWAHAYEQRDRKHLLIFNSEIAARSYPPESLP